MHIEICNVCKSLMSLMKNEHGPAQCDSSAVYGSDARDDNCKECRPISASVLAAQSVACASNRRLAKKKLQNAVGSTERITAVLSVA
jgi:hypothetical protein